MTKKGILLLEDREIEQMSEDLQKDSSFPKINPPKGMDHWDVHRIVKTLKYFKDLEQEYEDYKLKEKKNESR